MRRAWVRELTGWLGALAVALIVAAQVAASARSELLFRDGDSLIVALFARSLQSGEPLDWAMSTVLFVPEIALFTGLDTVLPLGVDALLALSAVLNLLALYGALRLVAGRRREGRAPVAWSLLGIAAFGALAATETSASRDALELASLQLTTTYYSATVIGAVVAVGLVRRFVDRERGGIVLVTVLAAVAMVSTLSNPLFAAWATVPLVVVLAVTALRARHRNRMVALIAALVAGTALGFLARIPFAAWIANTGAGYAQPELWTQSISYYAGLVVDRLATPSGVLACALSVALIAAAVVCTIRAKDSGSRLVAAVAWVMPVLVVVGAIALGTHAARYLQPIAFAPVLVLIAAAPRLQIPRAISRVLIAATAVVLLVGAGLSTPRLSSAATTADPDLTCVTDWVDASGRTGAGQFWTARLPKLHIDDPARLVQVDHQLNGYAWLVNRQDFQVGEVSFLIEDAQTVQWQLPVPATPVEIIDCGRYRILDFGDTMLPLGPQRS